MDKIINYNHPYFNNMSTKTWQEKFNEELVMKENWGSQEIEFLNTNGTKRIKQFIIDLRKKDELELIKMLPKPKEFTDLSDQAWFRAEGFNGCLSDIEQLIKDYYNK